MSFAKNMNKSIDKNISKILSAKYSPRILAVRQNLDYVKQSATDLIKTSSNRVIQETADAIGDLICNKTANAEVVLR